MPEEEEEEQQEKPAGRSLLDVEGAGPGDRAEPLPSHGDTEANLHDGTTNHSTATEDRRTRGDREERIGGQGETGRRRIKFHN